MSDTLEQVRQLPPNRRSKEYLSGGYVRALSVLVENAIIVLGKAQDDLNREFSDKVYEEMLRDPAVSASVDILKALILAEPLRVVSKVQDKADPKYEESKKIADFVDYQLKNQDRPLSLILKELLDAIPFGSTLGEIVYEPDLFEGRVIFRLKDVKVRSRENYNLVVDRFYNVLGCVRTELGSAAAGVFTGATTITESDDVVPREKFVLLALQTKNSDPRGVSLIRAAWNAYYLKSQIWPQFLKFLFQFASPSLIGYTAEASDGDEIPVLDEYGNKVMNSDGTPKTTTQAELMFETLLQFQGGSVAVLRGGSKVDRIESSTTGEAFSASIDLFDRQIVMSILKTYRTLLEAKHGSKADSGENADIADVYVSGLQDILCGVLSRDLVRQIVKVNFGEATAKTYSPEVSLRAVAKQDFSKAASAISQLFTSGYLHTSQIAEIDAKIGLPERDLDAYLSELESEKEANALTELERQKLLNPGLGTTKPAAETPPEDDIED